jgi:superfamily II DNA or RNA helicase
MTTLFDAPAAKLVPRYYQERACEEAFRLWDDGTRGVLVRAATGAGKTPMSCLISDRWLARGPGHRVMVISYETQLVWQFAQEVQDFLGIEPAIEMEKQSVRVDSIPTVTVACRASLLKQLPARPEQLDELRLAGVEPDGKCVTKRWAESILRSLHGGCDPRLLRDQLEELQSNPEVHEGAWSRVHKFDPSYHWLLVWDEAHRHAYHLSSVGHVVDWFWRNEASRQLGLTATPKRFDGVSIGDKMFPGVALDYPLFSHSRPCALTDGYAVPYVQKYIQVEGVDFASIKKVAGDFDEGELERQLGNEETLAKLCLPMLDMAGGRRTLIFSPGVEMAKNVAAFINARDKVECPECGAVSWVPSGLIGDGAACVCGRVIGGGDVILSGAKAQAVWGAVPDADRKEIYRRHQSGAFQFLSVCGLCREGYNDPDVSCVAVFRPVSRKASGLADQMKGRACRPKRGLVEGVETAEGRRALIASSDKPDALVIDLVGVTGLGDCPSTVEIYAEGLPDEVREKAAAILLEGGGDVGEAISEARRRVEEERERLRLEREAAERRREEDAARRAKAGAKVSYTAHEVGSGRQARGDEATEKQILFIRSLGMELHNVLLSWRKAGRIIRQLKLRRPYEQVAYENGLSADQWTPAGPSYKQTLFLQGRGINLAKVRCGYDASQIIGSVKDPDDFLQRKLKEIGKARDSEDLDAVGQDMCLVRKTLREDYWKTIVQAGRQRRDALSGRGDSYEGEVA